MDADQRTPRSTKSSITCAKPKPQQVTDEPTPCTSNATLLDHSSVSTEDLVKHTVFNYSSYKNIRPDFETQFLIELTKQNVCGQLLLSTVNYTCRTYNISSLCVQIYAAITHTNIFLTIYIYICITYICEHICKINSQGVYNS